MTAALAKALRPEVAKSEDPSRWFSRRSHVAAEATEFSKELERLKRQERAVCDLTVSNPTRAGLPYDTEELVSALADHKLSRYQPNPMGQRSAREAIVSAWAERNVSVPANQIMLTSSTSEAYSHLFKLLCDPGDEVLVPEPSYPLFAELARYDSVNLKPYQLAFDGAWHIDMASVEAAVSTRCRAIVAVSPNNPTGTYVKQEEWLRLLDLELPLISDEVFWAYNLTSTHMPSALEVVTQARTPNSLVFALDGLSKYAGLPQVKLGWLSVAGSKLRVRRALRRLEFIGDTYLSPSTQVQLALPRLLQVSGVTRNAIRSRLYRNLACLEARARNSEFTLLPVEGGWTAMLQLPAILSDSEWVLGLLEAHRVLVQPGWFYDASMQPALVVSLLTPERDFENGVSQLVAYVGDRVRRG